MTKAQHTPAPWSQGQGREYWHIIAEDRTPVAVVQIGTANAEANARLISAAPELLAFALATAQTFGEDTMIGKEARAAIAKATGGINPTGSGHTT